MIHTRVRGLVLGTVLCAVFCTVFGALLLNAAVADGPTDNEPSAVRPVPPAGIEIPAQTIDELLSRAAQIDQRLAAISELDAISRAQVAVLPRAVRMTIETNMFYTEKEPQQAAKLLDEAERRLQAIAEGLRGFDLLGATPDQTDRPQLVIGGYFSKIDGSAQPFGLVLPVDWQAVKSQPVRLDVWLHGRGEKVSEVGFLNGRLNSIGEFAPAGTIVLHPYGRYCNAFKFAGEIDVLEAVEQVQRMVSIDNSRIMIRGFSMGGAGCWQLAVHYPQLWAAANPGAGFSETTEFLRVFQNEDFQPTPSQRQLLHWYDCPDWTNNLRNVLTVAYSGEIDRQKQAADVMQAAFESRGMQLTHIIGPQTAHKIHSDSKPQIEALLAQALTDGKPEVPESLDLTTYTLRYHELGWLSIEGLVQHWQEARVQAQLQAQGIELATHNVSRLRLQFPSEHHFATGRPLQLRIDGQSLTWTPVAAQQPRVELTRDPSATWRIDVQPADLKLRKRPGLQGPIDDAFMEKFVFVPPSSTGDSQLEQWIQSEYEHATSEWKRHFRGDIVAVPGEQVTEDLMRDHHLVLFGTPASNPLIAKIVRGLPIQWDPQQLRVGQQTYDATTHAPLLIYPNPLNPQRYVVINSGFTYREYAYLNNARQIPMLPDWAVIDITHGATTQYPGKLVQDGFFDEAWAATNTMKWSF